MTSEPELILGTQWDQDKSLPPYVREYAFHDTRKFRLDFAVPSLKFGVECDGAIWSKGAHSTPMGILRDMEKANLAVMLGWSVLRYSTAQVRRGEAIAQIRQWFEERSMELQAISQGESK